MFYRGAAHKSRRGFSIAALLRVPLGQTTSPQRRAAVFLAREKHGRATFFRIRINLQRGYFALYIMYGAVKKCVFSVNILQPFASVAVALAQFVFFFTTALTISRNRAILWYIPQTELQF
jgi:hypothetical protein